MKLRTIRLVIFLAAIAIIGIIVSQVFWVRKGLLINQSNFERAIGSALVRVAQKIEVNNHGIAMTSDPVVRISPHTYQVNIAEKIDINLLDYYLRSEFTNPFHKIDFQFEVCDKITNAVIYSRTENVDAALNSSQIDTGLPKFDDGLYYFKINFPNRPIVGSVLLLIWITAILILTFVIAFFAYTLNVIIKQRRLSEFQKVFINNLAHELKTPVSTIAISAEVITDPTITEDPERLGAYAEIIKSENERLSHQINKILELAKLERDEIILSIDKINAHEILETVVTNFRIKTDELHGTVSLHETAKQYHVFVDKVHFTNVINTLLDNALKYTTENPLIEITTKNSDRNILITIKDNGIGISKEYHKKIFDKFFRVPTGNLHDVKGHGIGLNYVKMISQAHKWKIEILSEPGRGSVFTLILPLKE